jgi:hypothetical protein
MKGKRIGHGFYADETQNKSVFNLCFIRGYRPNFVLFVLFVVTCSLPRGAQNTQQTDS